MFQVNLNREKKEKKVEADLLGFTQYRVFLFRKLKGRNRVYQDVPLDKIAYLEHSWKSRNTFLLVLGSIVIGIGLLFSLISLFFFIIFGIFIIIGIILVIKGSKQRGYFLINDEKWKFNLRRKDTLEKIEEFIRKIYFAKTSL